MIPARFAEAGMKRCVAEADRGQSTLPECLDDFIDESNPVRVIDVFADALDLFGIPAGASTRPSLTVAVIAALRSGSARQLPQQTAER
jgi:hypothetical protein